MRFLPCSCWALTIFLVFAGTPGAQSEVKGEPAVDPRALLERVIDHTRGLTSYVRMSMTIHRPDWERTSSLEAWTRGREEGYIRFVAPARDAGNATLKVGEKMWTYTPRLNRVIRLPYSMMSQGWAGSDFSYNDMSRTDALLRDYEHRLTSAVENDGVTVFTIEAVPHESAPVVWGKEVIVFRSDYVLLEHNFYDQEMALIKSLKAIDIAELGGRIFATRMRMTRFDEEGRWTEISYQEAEFDLQLEDAVFTVYSLRSGGSEVAR